MSEDPVDIEAAVNRRVSALFRDTVMPDVMTYVSSGLLDVKRELVSEYFQTTVKFKDDHVTIRVHNDIDIRQLRRLKVKNNDTSVNMVIDSMAFEQVE